MKVYLFSNKYNIYGSTNYVFNICTHAKKCDENLEFITFENRFGEWLVWFPVFTKTDSGEEVFTTQFVRFEHIEEVLDAVRKEISRQVEIVSLEKIEPNDIEIVGLKKLKNLN